MLFRSKCWDIRRTRKDCIIFNQFDEFGNPAWHYQITGSAIEEILQSYKAQHFAAYISNTGSAGTIAAGDYLKTIYPNVKVVASEALQCPTMLLNGFGGHRIEGIGDKHIPWVHNIRNTDVVTAIDDEDCMRLFRLFNEDKGKKFLANEGLDKNFVDKLELIGISGIANIISAIKTAKYYELTSDDVIVTLATDAANMYTSRLKELTDERGEYSEMQAGKDFERCLLGTETSNMKELT